MAGTENAKPGCISACGNLHNQNGLGKQTRKQATAQETEPKKLLC